MNRQLKIGITGIFVLCIVLTIVVTYGAIASPAQTTVRLALPTMIGIIVWYMGFWSGRVASGHPY